jgi:Protein of unknown function, DUF583.
MGNETRRDIKYSGNMTMPGGVYKRVDINGNVTFDGDLDCLEYRANGNGTVTGNLKSENTNINGSVTINGDAAGSEIEIHGDGRFEGDLKIDSVKAHGKLLARGDVKAEKLEVSGQFDVRGKCDAETFFCKGAFDVAETLNVGDATVNLYGTSRVKEIVGGKITVRKARGDRLGKFFATITNPIDFYKEQLTTETIEGDEVAIEHTKAKTVRGTNVRIGDGCEIDLVEYRGSFEKTSKASVLKHVKI